jgi:hypothetical protein
VTALSNLGCPELYASTSLGKANLFITHCSRELKSVDHVGFDENLKCMGSQLAVQNQSIVFAAVQRSSQLSGAGVIDSTQLPLLVMENTASLRDLILSERLNGVIDDTVPFDMDCSTPAVLSFVSSASGTPCNDVVDHISTTQHQEIYQKMQHMPLFYHLQAEGQEGAVEDAHRHQSPSSHPRAQLSADAPANSSRRHKKSEDLRDLTPIDVLSSATGPPLLLPQDIRPYHPSFAPWPANIKELRQLSSRSNTPSAQQCQQSDLVPGFSPWAAYPRDILASRPPTRAHLEESLCRNFAGYPAERAAAIKAAAAYHPLIYFEDSDISEDEVNPQTNLILRSDNLATGRPQVLATGTTTASEDAAAAAVATCGDAWKRGNDEWCALFAVAQRHTDARGSGDAVPGIMASTNTRVDGTATTSSSGRRRPASWKLRDSDGLKEAAARLRYEEINPVRRSASYKPAAGIRYVVPVASACSTVATGIGGGAASIKRGPGRPRKHPLPPPFPATASFGRPQAVMTTHQAYAALAAWNNCSQDGSAVSRLAGASDCAMSCSAAAAAASSRVSESPFANTHNPSFDQATCGKVYAKFREDGKGSEERHRRVGRPRRYSSPDQDPLTLGLARKHKQGISSAAEAVGPESGAGTYAVGEDATYKGIHSGRGGVCAPAGAQGAGCEVSVQVKRRPGRPRKNPLPSSASTGSPHLWPPSLLSARGLAVHTCMHGKASKSCGLMTNDERSCAPHRGSQQTTARNLPHVADALEQGGTELLSHRKGFSDASTVGYKRKAAF